MFWKLTKKDIFSSIHRNQTKIRVLLQIKTEVAKCMKNNLSKLTAMTIWMSFQYNDSQAGNKMHCDWHAVTHTCSSCCMPRHNQSGGRNKTMFPPVRPFCLSRLLQVVARHLHQMDELHYFTKCISSLKQLAILPVDSLHHVHICWPGSGSKEVTS